MPGKSGPIVFRAIVAKVVEQKEWIEFACIPEAEGATQLHARAFNCGLGLDDALHGSNGHDGLTSCSLLVALTAPSPRWIARLGGGLPGKGQTGYRRRELIDESLEKSPRRLIGNGPVRVYKARLERNVGFPARDKGSQGSKNLSQVQLCHGRPERTGRCSGNGRRLSAPRILTIGSHAPVDRVLEHGGKGAMVDGADGEIRLTLGELTVADATARTP